MNDKLAPDALIEAALLTQIEPLSERTMRELCVPPLSADKLIDVLSTLKARWHNRALQLVHTHEGWRFQIDARAFERLGSLQEQRAPRYSRAVMETLAIIAYRQPVTRGDIEDVRGVTVSPNILKTLESRGWIDVVGHRDTPGRPELFATTRRFLDDMSLRSLSELPALIEIEKIMDLVDVSQTEQPAAAPPEEV